MNKTLYDFALEIGSKLKPTVAVEPHIPHGGASLEDYQRRSDEAFAKARVSALGKAIERVKMARLRDNDNGKTDTAK